MRNRFAACLTGFALALALGGCETQEENGAVEEDAGLGEEGLGEAEFEPGVEVEEDAGREEGVGVGGAVEGEAVEEEPVEEVPQTLEEE